MKEEQSKQPFEEVSVRQRKGKSAEINTNQESGLVACTNTEMKRSTPEEYAPKRLFFLLALLLTHIFGFC